MHGHGGSGGMEHMPGTDMSGGTGTATMTLTGAGPRLTAGLLAGAMLVLALWWLARGFAVAQRASATTGPQRTAAPVERDAFGLGCHGPMSLGMAVTFVLLI